MSPLRLVGAVVSVRDVERSDRPGIRSVLRAATTSEPRCSRRPSSAATARPTSVDPVPHQGRPARWPNSTTVSPAADAGYFAEPFAAPEWRRPWAEEGPAEARGDLPALIHGGS